MTTKVKREIEKDFYWNGPDYQPKMCKVCHYFLDEDQVCARRCDWVYIHFPLQHKCEEWVKKEDWRCSK